MNEKKMEHKAEMSENKKKIETNLYHVPHC